MARKRMPWLLFQLVLRPLPSPALHRCSLAMDCDHHSVRQGCPTWLPLYRSLDHCEVWCCPLASRVLLAWAEWKEGPAPRLLPQCPACATCEPCPTVHITIGARETAAFRDSLVLGCWCSRCPNSPWPLCPMDGPAARPLGLRVHFPSDVGRNCAIFTTSFFLCFLPGF